MYFSSLRIHQFRCYAEQQIDFSPGANTFIGSNGQGKTSVLEAVGVLASLKSFRGGASSDLLKYDTVGPAICEGTLVINGLEHSLSVKLADGKRSISINKKNCSSLSHYLKKVVSVAFSPADLDIITRNPEGRRAWLDQLIVRLDPEFLEILRRFKKVLEHRNRLLREISRGLTNTSTYDQLALWTDEFFLLAAKVIHRRVKTVDNSVDNFAFYYQLIAEGRSYKGVSLTTEKTDKFTSLNRLNRVTLFYQSKLAELDQELLNHSNDSSEELILQVLKRQYKSMAKKEQIAGTSLFGPHRDDVAFHLNGYTLVNTASQGEIRSAALALRLTEVELVKNQHQQKPIILIDDFSSELDAKRRSFLLDYLLNSPSQIFLTTTEDIEFGKKFRVSNASVSCFT